MAACKTPEDFLGLLAPAEDGVELSDAQLEGVTGGIHLTSGDYANLDNYVKTCKYEGWSLNDAIAMLRHNYSRPSFQEYTDAYVDYVTSIW